MISLRKLVVIAAAIFVLTATAGAQVTAGFSKPCVITSIGQNSDAAIVKVLLNSKLKMGLDYNTTIKPNELGEAKTIIMVLGASAKGLGAAGINMDQEIARTEALLKQARQSGVKVIAMHTGGANRRGEASNNLISIVLKDADVVIVVAAGNADKFFDNAVKKPGVSVIETQTIAEAGLAAQKLFKN